MVTADVGRYQPNAWGLCDMHGNAAEWTRTAYRPYPYNAADGRDDPSAAGHEGGPRRFLVRSALSGHVVLPLALPALAVRL